MLHYRLNIKTLSPLHIGDGATYDGMTALEHKKNFIPLDAHALQKALTGAGIDLRRFVQWINETKRERDYRKPRIGEFVEKEFPDQAEAIVAQLVAQGKMQLENVSLAWINSDIWTCLKDMRGRPFIPGSELKGAIVTAIMYERLQRDTDFINELKKILEDSRPFLEEAYGSLKNIKALTEARKKRGFDNYLKLNIPKSQQRDFRRILTMRERDLRLIRTDLEKKLHLQPDRAEKNCDLIEEWRSGDKQAYRKKILAEKRKYDSKKIKYLSQKLELLEEKYWNKYLALSPAENDKQHKLMRFLQLSDSNAPAPGKITNCLIIHRNPKITMDLFFEMIDTGVQFQSALTLDRNELAWREVGFKSEQTQIIDLARLRRCIHDFSARILQEDLAYLAQCKDSGYRFPVASVKAHLEELQAQNQPDSPLLRIGKGQGFLSLTLASLIRDHAPEVYRKLLGVVQSDKNHPDLYPITRRLFVDGAGKYKFPGWMKLSFEEVRP